MFDSYLDQLATFSQNSAPRIDLHRAEAAFSRQPLLTSFVAEEVEKVNPDLVARDGEGKVNTVRYEAINAMLLNEFLKEHRKVEGQAREMQEQKSTVSQLKSTVAEQQVIIARQQKGMEALTAQLKEQAAQIQKVSAQLEVSKVAPETVSNK